MHLNRVGRQSWQIVNISGPESSRIRADRLSINRRLRELIPNLGLGNVDGLAVAVPPAVVVPVPVSVGVSRVEGLREGLRVKQGEPAFIEVSLVVDVGGSALSRPQEHVDASPVAKRHDDV